MHLVRYVDPLFGQYLLIGPLDEKTGRLLVLGPLSTRTMRVETLNNNGARWEGNGFTEKPVQHSYVEGTISVSLPEDLSIPSEWILISPYHSSETEYIPDRLDPQVLEEGWSLSFESEEDETTILLSGVYTRTAYGPGATVVVWQYHFTARGLKDVDEYSGAATYHSFQLVESEVSVPLGLKHTASASIISNPHGGGGDDGADLWPAIVAYCNKTQVADEELEVHQTARDASIYAALDNLSITTINGLEMLKDLLQPLEAVKRLRDLLKVKRDLLGLIKVIANFHLFWKYVVKIGLMNYHDLRSMWRLTQLNRGTLLKRLANSLMLGQGRETVEDSVGDLTITTVYTCKCAYMPDTSTLDGLLNTLNSLGLTPRFSDIWDLIPYSFVVDWVIPVGDAIDNMESNAAQQCLPFVYMVLGRKVTREASTTFQIGDRTVEMDLVFVNYTREVLDEFPPDVWLGVTLRDPRRQLITGGALFVQIL